MHTHNMSFNLDYIIIENKALLMMCVYIYSLFCGFHGHEMITLRCHNVFNVLYSLYSLYIHFIAADCIFYLDTLTEGLTSMS